MKIGARLDIAAYALCEPFAQRSAVPQLVDLGRTNAVISILVFARDAFIINIDRTQEIERGESRGR